MTSDTLLDWMRGHRPDPHVCPYHGAVVMFSEHGVGMCAACVRALRAAIDAHPIERRLAAFVGSACEHTTYVPFCPGGCGRFA